jgi:hypothetical protein
LRTNESKWYTEINFIATQITSYIDYFENTNFTSEECEQHFHLDASRPTTSVDSDYDAVQLFDFGALLAICAFMVRESTRERCSSSHKLCKGQAYTHPFMKKYHQDLHWEKKGDQYECFT